MPTIDDMRLEMEDAIGESEPRRQVDVAAAVQTIIDHLHDACELATLIGRSDWAGRMERLVEQIQRPSRSSGRVSSPTQLRPVGPVLHLTQWLESVQEALRNFEQEVMLAHEEDPVNFPLVRTAADWHSELGIRMERSAPLTED